MKKIKAFIARHGGFIAALAMVFATFSANSACNLPYYEEETPKGIDKLKRF